MSVPTQPSPNLEGSISPTVLVNSTTALTESVSFTRSGGGDTEDMNSENSNIVSVSPALMQHLNRGLELSSSSGLTFQAEDPLADEILLDFESDGDDSSRLYNKDAPPDLYRESWADEVQREIDNTNGHHQPITDEDKTETSSIPSQLSSSKINLTEAQIMQLFATNAEFRTQVIEGIAKHARDDDSASIEDTRAPKRHKSSHSPSTSSVPLASRISGKPRNEEKRKKAMSLEAARCGAHEDQPTGARFYNRPFCASEMITINNVHGKEVRYTVTTGEIFPGVALPPYAYWDGMRLYTGVSAQEAYSTGDVPNTWGTGTPTRVLSKGYPQTQSDVDALIASAGVNRDTERGLEDALVLFLFHCYAVHLVEEDRTPLHNHIIQLHGGIATRPQLHIRFRNGDIPLLHYTNKRWYQVDDHTFHGAHRILPFHHRFRYFKDFVDYVVLEMAVHDRPNPKGIAVDGFGNVHLGTCFGAWLATGFRPVFPEDYDRKEADTILYRWNGIFAQICSMINRYSEYIDEYNHRHKPIAKGKPPSFVPFDHDKRQMVMDSVMFHLAVHGVTTAMISNAYAYGIHYLASSGIPEKFESKVHRQKIQEEITRRVFAHGIPPQAPFVQNFFCAKGELRDKYNYLVSRGIYSGASLRTSTTCYPIPTSPLLVLSSIHSDPLSSLYQELFTSDVRSSLVDGPYGTKLIDMRRWKGPLHIVERIKKGLVEDAFSPSTIYPDLYWADDYWNDDEIGSATGAVPPFIRRYAPPISSTSIEPIQ